MPLVKANTARWSEFNNQRSPSDYRRRTVNSVGDLSVRGRDALETAGKMPALLRCRRIWTTGGGQRL